MISMKLRSTYKKYKNKNISFSDFSNYVSFLIKRYGLIDVLCSISKIVLFSDVLKILNDIKFDFKKKQIRTIGVYLDQGNCGGIARVNSTLVDIWIKLGYHVVLFTDVPPSSSDFKYSADAKRIVLPKGEVDLRNRLCLLKKYCCEEKVDVFVSHCWLIPENAYDFILLKSIGISYINYMHGSFTNLLYFGDPLSYISTCKMFDLNLCLAEIDYHFCTVYGINAHLISNPISEDLKNNNAISNLRNKTISIIGRISYEKNPLDSLEIFKNLHEVRKDIKLNIVGTGPKCYVDEVENYVKKNNLSDYVKLYTEISPNKINKFYLTSDCILFTSDSEGYPMVLLEACCFGVPVCMYELTYLAVVDGNDGIISSKYKDINGLSNKLIELINNDSKRDQVGRAARQYFLNLLKKDIGKEWDNIFKSLERGNTDFKSDKCNITKNSDFPSIIRPIVSIVSRLYLANKTIFKSKDYKVGHVVNFLPRKMVRTLRKIFHH